MLISDKKIRLWVSCAVLIGVGMAMAVLLNEPVQHERVSSREVVIDMPAKFYPGGSVYYSGPAGHCINPPEGATLEGPGWEIDTSCHVGNGN
jgi:hypothetical protein